VLAPPQDLYPSQQGVTTASNDLILRLDTPGLHTLLLGAADAYALDALAGSGQSLSADVVELALVPGETLDVSGALGDVLFMTGRADLQAGSVGNLGRLVTFLNKYPDRTVAIEGYTDSVGSEDYNQRLSERRADSVKSYLAGQGIGSIRLSASGKGESDPVAANDSASGRQQNRRVEVIISNPPAAAR